MPAAAPLVGTRRKLLQWGTALAGAAGIGRAVPAMSDPQAAPVAAGDPLWSDFCDQLKRAGSQIVRPEAPQDPFNRAEGLRYLTRLLRVSLEQNIEYADRQFPVFYQLASETVKIGADNPDNHYLNAQVDGSYTYRITGNRGSVSYIGFSSKAGSYGESAELRDTGFIDSSTLEIGADGRFELLVSSERQPGNWLPMSKDTRMLIVRQTFLDRANERPAELAIECLDGPATPSPLDPEHFSRQLLSSTAFVEGTARLFADWAQRYRQQPNRFFEEDQAIHQQAGGDPSIFYAHGYWELGENQALVIDIPPTKAEFWNLQINNYWMESLDYRYFTIHLNKSQVSFNADGSATLVLAHRDPGMPNWLHTTGHKLGTLLYREVSGQDPQYPQSRVIEL